MILSKIDIYERIAMNIDIPISLSRALSWMLISTNQNAYELNWDTEHGKH